MSSWSSHNTPVAAGGTIYTHSPGPTMSMRRGQAVHCAPISATSLLGTAFAMIVLLFVFAGAQGAFCVCL